MAVALSEKAANEVKRSCGPELEENMVLRSRAGGGCSRLPIQLGFDNQLTRSSTRS